MTANRQFTKVRCYLLFKDTFAYSKPVIGARRLLISLVNLNILMRGKNRDLEQVEKLFASKALVPTIDVDRCWSFELFGKGHISPAGNISGDDKGNNNTFVEPVVWVPPGCAFSVLNDYVCNIVPEVQNRNKGISSRKTKGWRQPSYC